jgi:hypothetical protein
MQKIERIPITGNTYPVKDKLKALGGIWNPDTKAWMIPKDKAEEAQKIMAAAPAKKPRNPYYNWREPTAKGPTKVCWECGRVFTYAECKRNDGDWNESYCGC